MLVLLVCCGVSGAGGLGTEEIAHCVMALGEANAYIGFCIHGEIIEVVGIWQRFIC